MIQVKQQVSRRAPSHPNRKASEYELNLQTKQAVNQRRAEAFAKEREEAEMDLDYSEKVIS